MKYSFRKFKLRPKLKRRVVSAKIKLEHSQLLYRIRKYIINLKKFIYEVQDFIKKDDMLLIFPKHKFPCYEKC